MSVEVYWSLISVAIGIFVMFVAWVVCKIYFKARFRYLKDILKLKKKGREDG